MTVQLIIKSAAQSVEDFKLDCEISWSIAQVKDQITTLYPTKPAREHQKLIYGGKLLPDHLPLKSVLTQSQEIHILHLVCPFPPKSESNKSTSSREKIGSPVCDVPPLNPSSIYPQMNQQLSTPVFPSGTPGVGGSFVLNTPGDAVHQYLAMQQMYTQFMTQYFSHYNGASPYGQVVPSPPPVQRPTPPVPQQNANPVAEARVVGEGWDFIDLLYLFSRATMLLAVLIYYSSPPRVIAVCVLVLLLTLFAKLNRERQQQEEIRRSNQRETTESNAPQEVEVSNESTENPEGASGNASSDLQPDSSTPPTYVQTALTVPSTILAVITSFFTSLIPADPVPVNVN